MRDEEMDAYRQKAIDAARGRFGVWSDGVPNPAPDPPPSLESEPVPTLPEHSKRSRKGPVWRRTVIEWEEFKRRKQKPIMVLLSAVARECARGGRR